MSALLDERGIDCLAVADGRDGLRCLAEEILTLDLLVTDLVMPGLSGQALVEAVRGQGGERELPILVLSGNLDPGRVDALRAAGADAVVDKAGGLALAVAAARELLESRGWLRPARSPAAEAPACLCRIALTRTRRD